MNINNLTDKQKDELFEKLQADKQRKENDRRESYEGLRADFVNSIRTRVLSMADNVRELYDFVVKECGAFYEIMKEYGQLRKVDQLNYKVDHDGFRIDIRTYKVKGFDERADIAAARLIEYLEKWIDDSAEGTDDPMYQLAMTLLERNRQGDLDYKSISKLYKLEGKFNSQEYSDIMQLFRDSNTIEGTATNFYFHLKDDRNVWRKIEINFNRL